MAGDSEMEVSDDGDVVAVAASVPHVQASTSGSSVALNGRQPRATSVLSSSSSLTDPEQLQHGTNGAASDPEDDDEDDDIVEVNSDGTKKAGARVSELFGKHPSHPKHRWETAYVFAFIERFTHIRAESIYAPQTIFEFEDALQNAAVPFMPASTDDEWTPSLEPVFTDFISRIKAADRAAGGTGGGPKGGWQSFVPWWIVEQRVAGSPDFEKFEWSKTAGDLRSERGAIHTISWEKKLVILKALVDFQLANCEPLRNYINELYGYGKAGDLKEKKDKEEKDRADAPIAKEKGKEKEKSKPTAAAGGATTVIVNGRAKEQDSNHLVILPLGKDRKRRQWVKVDASPRLYLTSKVDTARPVFVAVSDTVEEIEEILESLHSSPSSSGPSKANGTDDVFLKAKASKKAKTSRDQNIENEQILHARLTEIYNGLNSDDSVYFADVRKFRTKRYNLVKKRDRESRLADVAAQRSGMQDLRSAGYNGGSLRSSTRLRRGMRKSADSYDDGAGDEELERALRESEREHRRKRRRSGSGYDEVDYTGMDLDNDEDEEDYDEEDEDGGAGGRRRSSRQVTKVTTKPVIPPERRSARTRALQQDGEAELSGGEDDYVSEKPAVVRRFSPEPGASSPQKFGGLEEVWSMGRYRGYYEPDGKTFVKAEKGDVPLYKLIKLGLPLPNEPGYIRGSSVKAEETDLKPSVNGDGLTSVAAKDKDLGESLSSLPDSAVPTLEPENGEDSRDSPPSSQAYGQEAADKSGRASPDVTMVSSSASKASRGSASKKRIEVIIS